MRVGKYISNIVGGIRIDPEMVEAYRSAIPNDIQVRVAENGDSYRAVITGLEHEPLPKEIFLITEAKTHEDLIDMVNDLILTYKKIPVNYRPYYKRILKPEGAMANSESFSLVKSA